MPSSRSLRRAGATLAAWQSPQWVAATAGAALTAVLVGVPTAVVPSPLFSRSVPVQWWNYPVLAATAVLGGLVLATFLRSPHGTGTDGSGAPEDHGDPSAKTAGRLGSAGGLLSLLAVGCPVCNKLVLVLLGTSGALTYWAPLQPLVAAVSLVLLAEAALRRLSPADACPVPVRR
ncbi:integral membrane protein [Streptomyces viridosporus ATCC 14672]|uniref:Integral membrane protein n=1 Tax=Streptomyces viridosporus (strain ATCC 14672 / DSM 40746 / JCM 4963 / KCTC 9882 / NRRL B-12104 / FH 1290) TaxID=566461 RepID=D6A750_STRV1|nr:hypothetical protein [Streptomyces viridosporus]EFE71876.1 integral membrane protein [Streptomyces viridosporus ATCC 14672]